MTIAYFFERCLANLGDFVFATMEMNNNEKAFFTLLRAGLWEKDAQLLPYGEVDYQEIMRLAEEQSVVGLITAGLEHVTDVDVPKIELLQFIGQTLQIEESNKAMNAFIGDLMAKMRDADIYTLLVKGQGIAQCYERPLWRSNGDVDFLLSDDNYQKAKEFLTPLASHVDNEDKRILHQGMTIDGWVVELHGTMRTQISSRMNRGIDDVQQDLFYGGNVRSWMNGNTQIFLPGANNDAILIFTHFLQHFFIGGVGLRQICDWCRLLWTYKDSLNHGLLESRIRKMGLMSEWEAFGAFAVEYLGMPVEAMPFYDSSVKWKRKAERLLSFILKVGNMGHNHDYSFRQKYSGLLSYLITYRIRLVDSVNRFIIFPVDAPKFFVHYVMNRFVAKLKR